MFGGEVMMFEQDLNELDELRLRLLKLVVMIVQNGDRKFRTISEMKGTRMRILTKLKEIRMDLSQHMVGNGNEDFIRKVLEKKDTIDQLLKSTEELLEKSFQLSPADKHERNLMEHVFVKAQQAQEVRGVEGSGENVPLLDSQMVVEEEEVKFDQEMLREQEETHAKMKQIAQDVVTVREMFQDMSELVAMHQERLDHLDELVYKAKESTERAEEEVRQTSIMVDGRLARNIMIAGGVLGAASFGLPLVAAHIGGSAIVAGASLVGGICGSAAAGRAWNWRKQKQE
jgi:hypothetical protein